MATKNDTELMCLDARGAAMVRDLRLSTVNRVARLLVADEAGLVRIHTISNDGVELSSIMDLPLGHIIRLDFSETVSMRAVVNAREGGRYRMAFQYKINCAELLRQLVAEARSSRARPLRLKTPPIRAKFESLNGIRHLELENISQRGMRVRNDGSFEPELPLWIQLPNGRECRGIVRWTRAGSAGLQLLDVLSANELGGVTRLWSVPLRRFEASTSRAALPRRSGGEPTKDT